MPALRFVSSSGFKGVSAASVDVAAARARAIDAVFILFDKVILILGRWKY